jgi:hypothetical protein
METSYKRISSIYTSSYSKGCISINSAAKQQYGHHPRIKDLKIYQYRRRWVRNSKLGNIGARLLVRESFCGCCRFKRNLLERGAKS